MKLNKYFSKYWSYLLLFFLTIPVIFPLFQPGFFQTDDGNWMIIRLSAFHEALKAGQFPVRFLERLNHGYGYPVLHFLYPLPFYLGEIIHLLKFSFVDSVKILFAGSFLFGALSMFIWISSEWGAVAGLLAALFYTFFPYRIFDVYKRGSLGEALAFIFIPLVFYFYDKLITTRKLRHLAFGAISLAALITSHNSMAFIFLAVLIMDMLSKTFQSTNKQPLIINNLSFIILSLGLSAFFWLPALYDLQFTRASHINVADYSQYFLRSENFISLVGLIIPICLFFIIRRLIQKKDYQLTFTLLITVLSLFLASPFSSPLWNFPILPRFVQFPWRFLALTAFSGAVIFGYFFRQKNFSLLVTLVFAAILIVNSQLPFLNLDKTHYEDSFYSTNDDTTTVKNEYMPKWVQSDPTNRPDSIYQIVSGQGRVENTNTINAQTTIKVIANQVYFPGQTVFINNLPVTVTPSDNGLLSFSIPPGKHEIKIVFRETPVRLIADIIALLSLALALWLIK